MYNKQKCSNTIPVGTSVFFFINMLYCNTYTPGILLNNNHQSTDQERKFRLYRLAQNLGKSVELSLLVIDGKFTDTHL